MKTLGIFTLLMALAMVAGCGLSLTKVRAQVVEHKKLAARPYYAILYKVIEPRHLAGLYGVGTTQRADLVTHADGGEYEVYLNSTMVGALDDVRPTDYDISPPDSKDEDFLEMAKRLK